MKIAVLGMGSVRCAPAIIGSFACYFGERPLEIAFWDADSERLDLFDRFARLCFQMTKATHQLVSTEDHEAAIQGAEGIVLAVGRNCARKFLKERGSLMGHGETRSVLVNRCASELLDLADLNARVLSLIDVEPDGRDWTQADWPPEPDQAQRKGVPHQLLRYLNGEEYAHAFLRESAPSPVTEWLDAWGAFIV